MLLLEPKEQNPDVVQQRRAIDLVGNLLDLEIFHRAGDRSECGNVAPDRLRIKGAQAAILTRRARRGGRGGIKVPPQIEERATELVGDGH